MFTHKVEIHHRSSDLLGEQFFIAAVGGTAVVSWDNPRYAHRPALFVDLALELLFWTATATFMWMKGR